ncbi:MAG: MATE family efflux transporter [Clostridia bacterium]|nr:MATE family efflux transporter [Clostridia bacterium]
MKESTRQLEGYNSYKKLIFTSLPMIGMMIVSSIYGVVDGIFVSNVVGDTAFAAVNFILPYLMILGCTGMMIGTGGSALIAKTLGEGDKDGARKYFSMLVIVLLLSGAGLTLLGELLLEPVAVWMGASEEMLGYCLTYGRVFAAFTVTMMLQYAFQAFLAVAGKPSFAFWITVLAGVTNMVLDYLFVYVFPWGVAGAAIATGISQTVGGGIPLVYFLCKNSTGLRVVPTGLKWKPIVQSCYNGLSEMCSNVAMSVANMLYNAQLMRLVGQDGVTAYGIIMYVAFLFVGVYFGYAMGVSPRIGYNFGAQNRGELRNILKKSLVILSVTAILMTGAAELFAMPLSKIFVGYSEPLSLFTARALRLYFTSFLLSAFNIFFSAFFTSLSNGTISAILSLARSFVFQVGFIYLLPLFWDVDGVWLAMLFSEACSLALSLIFVLANRKRYGYGSEKQKTI